MPIFKKYDENGKQIGTFQEQLTEQNFDKFVEEYGQDKAIGYLDAIEEMSELLSSFMTREPQPGFVFSNTLAKIRRSVINLYTHNKSVLTSDKNLELVKKVNASNNCDTRVQP